jgi:hypothetical protein
VEGAWLEAKPVELARLKRRIIAAGETPDTGSGIIGWIIDKQAGERDLTSAPTRARYRKILAELEAPPAPTRRRARGESGAVHVRSAACSAVAAGATIAVATGHPAVAAMLAPIILGEPEPDLELVAA